MPLKPANRRLITDLRVDIFIYLWENSWCTPKPDKRKRKNREELEDNYNRMRELEALLFDPDYIGLTWLNSERRISNFNVDKYHKRRGWE